MQSSNRPESASPLDAAAVASITQRLDDLPLGPVHIVIAVICAAAFAIDLLEVTLGSTLSAVFSTPPHKVGAHQLSWLLAAVYLGAIFGATLLGWVADRRGPRWTLLMATFWIAGTSIAAAASGDVGQLTLVRFLSGMAIGGFPPLLITYLAEIAPRADRGALTFAVCGFASFAPPIGVFAIRALTPLHPFGVEAWRFVLLLSGVLAVGAGVGFARMPESARWLLAKGRTSAAAAALKTLEGRRPATRASVRPAAPSAADAVEVGGEAGPNDLLKRFSYVASLYFLHPWATVAFPLITGPILLTRHFNLTDTLLYVGLSAIGPAVGTFLGGLVIDRFPRRVALVSCAAMMLASVLAFFASSAHIVLGVSLVLFGVTSSLYLALTSLYGAETLPTRVRAWGTSAAWACNRVGAAVAALVVLPMIRSGTGLITATICAALGLSIVLIVTVGAPGAAGRSIDQPKAG